MNPLSLETVAALRPPVMQLQKLRLPVAYRAKEKTDPTPVAERAVPHPNLANQSVSALPKTDCGARSVRPNHTQRSQSRRVHGYQIVLNFTFYNCHIST